MVIGSKELIRDINSKLVLETIIDTGAISRAAISKQLGLTKATISAIVGDLMNAKLVVEIGSDDTVLGRKPILLSFNKKAGYAICIDVGVTMLSAIVTDLQGENRTLKQIATPPEEDLVETLIDFIHTMKPTTYTTPYDLVGITLAIHGITSNNKVVFTPYYDLSNIDLAEKLTEYFQVPVFLENEANLSVLGENTYLPNSYSNVANISIHSGVGLGLIIDHKIYTGFAGHAGEFGHTIIEIDGLACPCGNHGCLEQYASERALIQTYQTMTNNPSATFATFVHDYKNKRPEAITLARLFVKYISVCVNNVSNSFDPDIIILNSSFTIAFPELIEDVRTSLHSKMNTKVPIVPSLLKECSVLIGGVCVAIKNFLGIEKLLFQLESEN